MPDGGPHGGPGGDQPAELHRTLRRQLRQLGLGPDDPPDPAGWGALLDRVSTTYRGAEADRYTLERSLEVSSEEMRALHDALSDQARHDALTGLPNRVVLAEYLQSALNRPPFARSGPAVLFIDLDGFKLVNDSLGHRAGDDLLVRVAERIRAASRDSDLVARIGGDEFVVALGEVEGTGPAMATAQRIADRLQQPFNLRGQDSVIGASIGISLAYGGSTTADELLRQADMAMYAAKAGGRNRCVVFDGSIAQRAESQLSTVNALRQAIDTDQLVLLYQPVVSLTDGRRLTVEALLRWDRSPDGLVGPEVFRPVAEQADLTAALDAWVIRHACAEVAGEHDTLTVNLSARSLRNPDIADTIDAVLRSTGRRPEHLVVELTESVFALGGPATTNGLTQVRALGVQLAIGDFGTGHSTLGNLQRTPADLLKVDRSLVAAVDEDGPGPAIVAAIVQLGHAVGLQVIAEGVERPAQLDALRRLGCDGAQGSLIGPPQPASPIATDLHGVRVTSPSARTGWLGSLPAG